MQPFFVLRLMTSVCRLLHIPQVDILAKRPHLTARYGICGKLDRPFSTIIVKIVDNTPVLAPKLARCKTPTRYKKPI